MGSITHNLGQLIAMLSCKLKDNGISCREGTGDTDTIIVTTAFGKSSFSDRVAILGEDRDLVVFLIVLTPLEREIVFVKPNREKIERKVFFLTIVSSRNETEKRRSSLIYSLDVIRHVQHSKEEKISQTVSAM